MPEGGFWVVEGSLTYTLWVEKLCQKRKGNSCFLSKKNPDFEQMTFCFKAGVENTNKETEKHSQNLRQRGRASFSGFV